MKTVIAFAKLWCRCGHKSHAGQVDKRNAWRTQNLVIIKFINSRGRSRPKFHLKNSFSSDQVELFAVEEQLLYHKRSWSDFAGFMSPSISLLSNHHPSEGQWALSCTFFCSLCCRFDGLSGWFHQNYMSFWCIFAICGWITFSSGHSNQINLQQNSSYFVQILAI